MKPMSRAAALWAGVSVMACVSGGQAQAGQHLVPTAATITSLTCATRVVPPGTRVSTCEVSYAVTAPPASIRWYDNGVLDPADNDQPVHEHRCAVGARSSIRVVVSDADGVPDQRSVFLRC